MEGIFLNVVQWINDNRLWLGPLLLICIWTIGIREMIKTIKKDNVQL